MTNRAVSIPADALVETREYYVISRLLEPAENDPVKREERKNSNDALGAFIADYDAKYEKAVERACNTAFENHLVGGKK